MTSHQHIEQHEITPVLMQTEIKQYTGPNQELDQQHREQLKMQTNSLGPYIGEIDEEQSHIPTLSKTDKCQDYSPLPNCLPLSTDKPREQIIPIVIDKQKELKDEYDRLRMAQYFDHIDTLELRNIPIVILMSRPTHEGVLIDRRTLTKGDALSMKDINRIRQNKTIKYYVGAMLRRQIAYTLQSSTRSENISENTVYITLSKELPSNTEMNSTFNESVYYSYLYHMLDIHTTHCIELDIYCSMLRDLIHMIRVPISDIAYTDKYTDMLTAFFIIDGRYNGKEVERMSNQLVELFFSHNSFMLSNVYPYIVGEPKVNDIYYEYCIPLLQHKIESMHVGNLGNNKVTITTIPMFFNIPHMKRELLLQRGYIVPRSFKIPRQITGSSQIHAVMIEENNIQLKKDKDYLDIEHHTEHTRPKITISLKPDANTPKLVFTTYCNEEIENYPDIIKHSYRLDYEIYDNTIVDDEDYDITTRDNKMIELFNNIYHQEYIPSHTTKTESEETIETELEKYDQQQIKKIMHEIAGLDYHTAHQVEKLTTLSQYYKKKTTGCACIICKIIPLIINKINNIILTIAEETGLS